MENSYINVEDDSLCIKSGMDAIGRNYGRPTRDVIFRNNTLGRGGGLTIGSEGSGGVYNVSYENLTLNGTSVAVHIKSRPSRGGVYDGIVFKDIIAHNVYSLFSVSMGGECISQASGFCSNATRPQLNNVLVQDVRCDPNIPLERATKHDALLFSHRFPVRYKAIAKTDSGQPAKYVIVCAHILYVTIRRFTADAHLTNRTPPLKSIYGSISGLVDGGLSG